MTKFMPVSKTDGSYQHNPKGNKMNIIHNFLYILDVILTLSEHVEIISEDE